MPSKIPENAGRHLFCFGIGATIIVKAELNGSPAIFLKSLMHAMPSPDEFEGKDTVHVVDDLMPYFKAAGDKLDFTLPDSYDSVLLFIDEAQRDYVYDGMRMKQEETIYVK